MTAADQMQAMAHGASAVRAFDPTFRSKMLIIGTPAVCDQNY
jgi:hypothetical protein